MKHLDLFSGIGGFALAADRVWPGIEHVFVDNDLFCQAILKKHWPNAKIYGDIKCFTNTNNENYYILTGGFPCQPFSQAGQRKGTADDRYLWPEMLRVIREFKPTWVIAENVRGLLTWNEGLVFETVCADLESIGYEVQPIVIPACAVGAPHRRDRVWIVAHTEPTRAGSKSREVDNEEGRTSQCRREGLRQTHGEAGASGAEPADRDAADAGQVYGGTRGSKGIDPESSERGSEAGVSERCGETWNENWPEVAARLCRMDDGLPEGISRPRGWRNAALKAYGNAIVPQVAEQIMIGINHSLKNKYSR